MGSLVVNIHYGGVRGWVVLFRHGCRKLPFTCWRRRFFTFYGFPVLVCGKATPRPIAPAHRFLLFMAFQSWFVAKQHLVQLRPPTLLFNQRIRKTKNHRFQISHPMITGTV